MGEKTRIQNLIFLTKFRFIVSKGLVFFFPLGHVRGPSGRSRLRGTRQGGHVDNQGGHRHESEAALGSRPFGPLTVLAGQARARIGCLHDTSTTQ